MNDDLVKGILLSKTPFQERHIIGRVLLTSGEFASFIFYGGQGGGKRQKPSTLELGYCLEIKIKKSGRTSSDLLTAGSWQAVWSYDKLRADFKAYSLMCFYLEIIQKLATELDVVNFKKYGLMADNGLFNVTSNALFYLEKSLKEDKFSLQKQLSLFLVKTLLTQGVAPDITRCIFCSELFNVSKSVFLLNDLGGFSCSNCAPPDLQNMQINDLDLLTLLQKIWPLKYAEFEQLDESQIRTLQGLYRYFCYQFQFEPHEFKSSTYVL